MYHSSCVPRDASRCCCLHHQHLPACAGLRPRLVFFSIGVVPASACGNRWRGGRRPACGLFFRRTAVVYGLIEVLEYPPPTAPQQSRYDTTPAWLPWLCQRAPTGTHERPGMQPAFPLATPTHPPSQPQQQKQQQQHPELASKLWCVNPRFLFSSQVGCTISLFQ